MRYVVNEWHGGAVARRDGMTCFDAFDDGRDKEYVSKRGASNDFVKFLCEQLEAGYVTRDPFLKAMMEFWYKKQLERENEPRMRVRSV